MAKLYIIAGHGAGDPGAVGGGYNEAERVRALAERMKALGGSSVEVLNTARNWYEDNGISSLSLPSGACLIELHMDSASPGARGGHVIINHGFSADAYDNALAKFIGGYFPGRSELISKRGDLANPARAAARGINYRLLEVCFITNSGDLAKFNGNLDAVAKGILGAFGIGAAAGSGSASTQSAGKPAAKPSAGGQPKYNVMANGRWLETMEGLHDTGGSGDDFGGMIGAGMQYLAVDGVGKYRVASQASGWLPYVSKRDLNDLDNGCAGDGSAIVAVEIPNSAIKYQVHVRGGGWLPWMVGTKDTGGSADTFAGNMQPIDAIRIKKA